MHRRLCLVRQHLVLVLIAASVVLVTCGVKFAIFRVTGVRSHEAGSLTKNTSLTCSEYIAAATSELH